MSSRADVLAQIKSEMLETDLILDFAPHSFMGRQDIYAMGHLVDLGWAIKHYHTDRGGNVRGLHYTILTPRPITVAGRLFRPNESMSPTDFV